MQSVLVDVDLSFQIFYSKEQCTSSHLEHITCSLEVDSVSSRDRLVPPGS